MKGSPSGLSFFSGVSFLLLLLLLSLCPYHRMTIRQISSSAASLHDMPSLACGASLDIILALSIANTQAYPSHLAISTACPLRKPSTPTPTPFYPPPLSSLLTPVSSLLIAFRLSLPYPLCFPLFRLFTLILSM